MFSRMKYIRHIIFFLTSVSTVISSAADQLEFLISPKVHIGSETAVLIQKVRNIFEAKSFCKLNGAKMYEPRNMANYKIIKDFAAKHHLDTFWVGVSDHVTEGNFQLLNGDPLAKEFSVCWANGQPDSYIPLIQ